jgi:DnaJ-class molecular chaperone
VDHYRTLNVTRDADPAVIEKAYKALSMRHHPDRVDPTDRASATKRMQRINQAYKVLRDPESRRRYDATLPSETHSAWDEFWERGLVGIFIDRYFPERGGS